MRSVVFFFCFVFFQIQNINGLCEIGDEFGGSDNYLKLIQDLDDLGTPFLVDIETPIVVRLLLARNTLQWNCLATYNDDILTLRTRMRPILSDKISSSLHTTNNSFLCYLYGLQSLFDDLLGAYSNGLEYILSNEWGLKSLNEIIKIRNKISQCNNDDESCLDLIASSYNYCPDVMGIINAQNVINGIKNDGYNAHGNITPFGECTANCRPYSDPLGLFDDRVKSIKHNKFSWVKLLEDDGKGFFFKHEHVTPHIGLTVDPISMTRNEFDSLSDLIDDPCYDYKYEANLVIERLKDTANNVTKKAIIEIMDSKLLLGTLIRLSYTLNFNPSYEQYILYDTGLRLGEYEAILISWKEKIKYNLIRPTTIIQSGKYTDDFITTYGGPLRGIQTIKTQDFQPYIRVMPHSEYISGSGCICRILYDVMDEYMINEHNQESTSINFFFIKKISQYEPGLGQENISFMMNNMNEVYEYCRQSRLWGGMHFTASIEAADKICKNVGNNIYKYLKSLLNGTVSHKFNKNEVNKQRNKKEIKSSRKCKRDENDENDVYGAKLDKMYEINEYEYELNNKFNNGIFIGAISTMFIVLIAYWIWNKISSKTKYQFVSNTDHD